MSKNLDILKKYLYDSEENMSSYGIYHIKGKNFKEIENPMNSGTFVKANNIRKIKYLFAYILQILIWRKEMFKNEFIKRYQNLCKQQSRIMNYELIIHGIVLKILNNKNILKDNICVIGDGKANFVNGVINFDGIEKIYSINLPEALIQDYIILTQFKTIDENLIKIVENEDDLNDKGKKIFLIPAKNKEFLKSKGINLFVNMHSFQEMPIRETHKYIEIVLSNSAFLYSLNREEKIMYDGTIIKYADYGLNKKGEIIFDEEAKFVKYYYNSRIPFIHRKRSKIINTLAKF